MLASARDESLRELQAIRVENLQLKRNLDERKLIERAKGILMEKEGISENAAYRRIQKLSMDRRKKMVEIAEAIIIAEEARK